MPRHFSSAEPATTAVARISNPPAETIVRAGDRVRIFGLPDQIEAFRLEAATVRLTS